MAPTEILARQHYQRLAPMLEAAGVSTILLTGRDTQGERRQAAGGAGLGRGPGRHRHPRPVPGRGPFERLALAVIDEQHRFGVNERQRLQAKGDPRIGGVHLLTMSATPIPRTLELTQYGELEVSRLMEKPPGRTPVATAVLPLVRIGEVAKRLKAAIDSGAQAYWICPLVAECEAIDLAAAEERANDLRRILQVEVGLAHGQMPGRRTRGGDGRVRRGPHPAAGRHHGRRGRGRRAQRLDHGHRARRPFRPGPACTSFAAASGAGPSPAPASCCTAVGDGALGETARERLETLRRTEDGFEIAEEDFRLRGGGDPLGLKQSGFPAYRFADPIKHRSLMLAASDDARLILGRDPDLTSPRGAAVRVLEALFDWRNDRPGVD